MQALEEEFKDRFGPPPEPVLNLFFQLRIKLAAEQIGLASISSESGQLVLRFPEGSVPAWVPELNGNVRTGKTALWMPYNPGADWREALSDLLQKLAAIVPQAVR